jgi:hypothetical protein
MATHALTNKMAHGAHQMLSLSCLLKLLSPSGSGKYCAQTQMVRYDMNGTNHRMLPTSRVRSFHAGGMEPTHIGPPSHAYQDTYPSQGTIVELHEHNVTCHFTVSISITTTDYRKR